MIIDRLIKKLYYVLYTISNNDIFIKNTIEMLIKKVFYINKLFISIMFDRDSQFVVII